MSDPNPAPRAMYAAFDRFPGPKGSAVHIGRAAGALFEYAGSGLLCVLGGGLPSVQHEGTVTIRRFVEPVENLLMRADRFACFVDEQRLRHRSSLGLVQVRDPWSAAPVLADPERRYRVVYEANGFPSIELPVAWPRVPAATLEKIARVESACLANADAVVTPSATIARLAIEKGANPDKVSVVRNGADPVGTAPPRPVDAPARYLVYVGALQAWQGIGTALQALSRLADTGIELVICASWPQRRARPWRRLAERLGLEDRVHWRYELPHEQVAGWLAYAEASLAPLTDTERNVVQGCCPLKVVESLAVGTPVVASDLPCVRELLDDSCARLVPADRPAELARTLRGLLDDPQQRRMLGEGARRRAATFTWDGADAQLREIWSRLATGADR